MKPQKISYPLIVVLALGLAGCSKNEPATPTADNENKTASPTAEAVAETAETANAEAEHAIAITNIAPPTNAVQLTEAMDSSRIQELIDKAKGLVAESKFADASSTLQQLAGQTLTDEQTKLVDALKEQIQKALSAEAVENATGGVGNLLGD